MGKSMEKSSSGLNPLHLLWALCLGVTVPLDMINQVELNSRAASPAFQAIYTSGVIQVTAMFLILPIVLIGTAPWGKPTRYYTLFAGMYGSWIYAVPVAAHVVGSEVAVLLVLSAQLCTGLVLDYLAGIVKISDWQKIAGFGLVLLGAFANVCDAESSASSHQQLPRTISLFEARNEVMVSRAFSSASDEGFGGSTYVLLGLAVLGGIGVTFESSCNCILAKDLGCWSRAACWDTFVSAAVCIPVGFFFFFQFGAVPVLLASDWMRFLFSAAIIAFYVSSMAVLPMYIGTTLTFMAVKGGCIFMSTYADAMGLGGVPVVPASTHRLASLLLIACGCVLFASSKGPEGGIKPLGYGTLRLNEPKSSV